MPRPRHLCANHRVDFVTVTHLTEPRLTSFTSNLSTLILLSIVIRLDRVSCLFGSSRNGTIVCNKTINPSNHVRRRQTEKKLNFLVQLFLKKLLLLRGCSASPSLYILRHLNTCRNRPAQKTFSEAQRNSSRDPSGQIVFCGAYVSSYTRLLKWGILWHFESVSQKATVEASMYQNLLHRRDTLEAGFKVSYVCRAACDSSVDESSQIWLYFT